MFLSRSLVVATLVVSTLLARAAMVGYGRICIKCGTLMTEAFADTAPSSNAGRTSSAESATPAPNAWLGRLTMS